MTKIRSADAAVALIGDNATIAVNSSSGLCCPDAILKALGERFEIIELVRIECSK